MASEGHVKRRHFAAATTASLACVVTVSALLLRRWKIWRSKTIKTSLLSAAPNDSTKTMLPEILPLPLPAEQLAPDAYDQAGRELRLLRKAETVLSRRTGALIVVLERLQDGHNYCAVLRTMEALGVQHVWVVSPPSLESKNNIERRRLALLAEQSKRSRVKQWAAKRCEALWSADANVDDQHTAFAQGAQRWLTVREFDSAEACAATLRSDGRTIWATALEQQAHVLAPGAPWLKEAFPAALPERLAVVFGTEGAGVSDTFKAASDRLVYLPLSGFAESLNVSVAAALVVQLLLQLLALAHPAEVLQLNADERSSLRAAWYQQLARNASDWELYEKLLASPPPPLDDLRRPVEHRRGRHH